MSRKLGLQAAMLCVVAGVGGCGVGVSTLSANLTATGNPAVDVGHLGKTAVITGIELPSQGLFGLSGPARGTETLYRQALTAELQRHGYRLTENQAQADLFVHLRVSENRAERAYWTGLYALDMFRYAPGRAQTESSRIAVFSSRVSVGYVPNVCTSAPRVAARSIGLLFESFPQGGSRETTIDMRPGC